MADKKISQLTAASTPLAGAEVLPVVQSGSTVKVAVSNLTAGRAISVGSLDSAGDVSVGTGNAGLTQLAITTTGEAADQKNWRFQTGTGIGTGVLRLRALNDAGTSGQNAWVVSRTADNIDSQNFLTGGSNRLSIGATDVTVSTGNLVVGTAAKGIDFSANTGAAGETSSLLNWYEEGSWTPGYTLDSGTASGVTASGSYTRIGRQVTLIFSIQFATASADIDRITGFPFTSQNATAVAVGSVRENAVTGNQWHLRCDSNNTQGILRRYDNNQTIANGYTFVGTLTYVV